MNKVALSFPLSLLYEIASFCLGCAVLRKHTGVKAWFLESCAGGSQHSSSFKVMAGKVAGSVAGKPVERIAWRHSLERCDCNHWEESKRQTANSASSCWKRN